MNILQKLIALIAKGQNPEFVAFMAHSMTYAFILSLIYHFTSVPVTTVAAIAMLALAVRAILSEAETHRPLRLGGESRLKLGQFHPICGKVA